MRRRLLPVVLVSLVAPLTACQDEPAGDSPAPVLGSGDQYVALGDSFTAAPRTGPEVGDNGCLNTTVNYPHRIAQATGAELVDNSCSGATTKNLTVPQPTLAGPHRPQLSGVDAGTELVTIRLGANDSNLYARIVNCARFFGRDAPGTPCADFDATRARVRVAPALAGLEVDLVRGLEEIEERAPHAQVFVIGYPQVIPEEGTCGLLPLPEGDHAYARRIIDGLNNALESAAAEVGATFIDMYGVSAGHDICGDDPWIAGASIAAKGATPWHPYAAEARAVAELVLAELDKA